MKYFPRVSSRKIDHKKFIELFYKKQWRTQKIANFFKVAKSSVDTHRMRNGLPTRGFANGKNWNSGKIGLQVAWNKGIKFLEKEHNPNWKGGKYIDKFGYKWVRVPDKTKNSYRGYMKEHRYVMSQFVGRPLKIKEHVHHKNHNRLDNRVSNLEIISPSNHGKLHHPKGSKFGINHE